MRRRDRQTDHKTALSILDRAEHMTLSLATPDGLPYAIPLSFARLDEALYFHCAQSSLKLDILRQQPRVCVVATIDGQAYCDGDDFTTSFESAIAFGTAFELTDETQRRQALTLLCEKYMPSEHDRIDAAFSRAGARTSVWAIRIESITGKVHE